MDQLIPALFALAVVGLMVASLWTVFTKAGEPGWAAIVPIYNIIIMLKIAGKPAWWFLLFFVPIVSIVVAFMVALSLAERFGKSAGFGVGLALLPFVFYPMLAFSDASYRGIDA